MGHNVESHAEVKDDYISLQFIFIILDQVRAGK